MNHPLVRWLLPLLRYGLCAVAIVLLYRAVSWYDRVALVGRSDPVRVVAEHDSEIDVIIDGRQQTVPRNRIDTEAEGTFDGFKPGIHSVVFSMNYMTALLAVLIFFPVPLLQSFRLVLMLAIQDVKLTYWNAIKLSYAGNFFNFALPGTTGGDLIKAYYITHYTHRKTEAVTTVFLDRVIGLLGLMFLATTMLIVSAWRKQIEWEPTLFHSLVTTLAAVWAGLLVGAVFVFSRRLRHAIKLPELAGRLPGGTQLLRIGRTTVNMRKHYNLVTFSLAITIALQLLVVISSYVMSRALHMNGGFELYFICVPIGFLIAAIPISPPQAFGVMEYAYLLFFTPGGLNAKSAAVAFALANRLIQLVWALPGVLVPLLGAHLPSKTELTALEDVDESSSNGAVAEANAPQ